MTGNGIIGCARRGLLWLGPLLLAGCSRAPSVDILGSFFPAWLLCFTIAVLLTVLVRVLLLRLQVKVPFPLLVYPSLAAFFTFALWLAFFY
jgi:hypothetical protein